MLSRLTGLLTGPAQNSHPSAVLTLEAFPEIRALHIVPEDGAEEIITYSKERRFSYGGAKERSREQLGSVLLRVSGSEALNEFFKDVSQRVKQDLIRREQSTGGDQSAYVVEQALRSAALSCIHERANPGSGPGSTLAAAQLYPIFLVQIDRTKPGKIVGEPRSISNW